MTCLLNLTSEAAQVMHSSGTLRWARTYLKSFGAIVNSAPGVWSLTEQGRRIQKVEPNEVVKHYNRNLQKSDDDDQDEGTQEEPSETAWRQQLLKCLVEMPPEAFERLSQRLLRECGFVEVEVTGKSGDGGIDYRGAIRLSGLISLPVLFQCKCYQGSVDVNVVRELRGAMSGRADRGLIIATGSFTQPAREEAERSNALRIDLIDGDTLIDLLKDLRLGINSRTVEIFEVDSTFFETI